MTDRLNPEALEAAACELEIPCASCEIGNDPNPCRFCESTAERIIRAYLAALPAPRTITTVEELEALPVGAVILDGSHYAAQSLQRSSVTGHDWYHSGAMVELASSEVELPAMVLWVPTEGGGDAT